MTFERDITNPVTAPSALAERSSQLLAFDDVDDEDDDRRREQFDTDSFDSALEIDDDLLKFDFE